MLLLGEKDGVLYCIFGLAVLRAEQGVDKVASYRRLKLQLVETKVVVEMRLLEALFVDAPNARPPTTTTPKAKVRFMVLCSVVSFLMVAQ